MKKIVSLLIIGLMILSSLPAAYAAVGDVICSAVLNADNPTVSNCRVVMGRDTTVTCVSHWGESAWRLSTEATAGGGYTVNSAYLYIDIDDSICASLAKSDTVVLSVRYYDNGDNKFSVGYDSYDAAETYGGHVIMSDPFLPLWKTEQFVLKKPLFNNRLNGYDIKLAVYSDYLGAGEKTVDIASVTVTRGETNPLDIKITSSKTGNVFYNAQRPSLKAEVTNISSASGNYSVDVAVTNRDTPETVYQDTQEVSLSADESHEIIIAPDVDYGIYYVSVTAKSGETVVSEHETEFSLVSAPLEGSNISDSYGVATHFYSQKQMSGEEIIPMMARAGFGLVRDSIEWNTVETSRGVYKIPDTFTRFVSNAKASGMEPLIIIGGVNKSVYPNARPYSREDLRTSNPTAADEGEARFQEYLTAAYNYAYNTALMLGDSVKYYEVGNEYNLAVTNSYFPSDGVQNRAADYARILEAIYTGIKAANPDAVVVGGVLAEMGDKIPSSYVTELYANGAGSYMDCLSVHFYKHGYNPGQSGYKAIDELQAVKNIIEENASVYGNKELWVTEYGWREFDGYKTEYEQAENLVKSRVLFAEGGLPDKAFWYLFDAKLPASLDNRYADYAIMRSFSDKYATGKVKGAAKSAYLAEANYAKLMADCVFVENKSSGNKQEYLFHDDKNNINLTVLWSLSGNQTFTFSEDEYDSLTVTDMYGNETSLMSQNGTYYVTVGSTPVYVKPYVVSDKLSLLSDNFNKIRFYGTIPTDKPVNVAVALLYPGKTKEDYIQNPILSSAYIGEFMTDAEGRYDNLIRLNGLEGTYTLLFRADGMEMKELQITWYKLPFDTELVIMQDGAVVDTIESFDTTKSYYTDITLFNDRKLSSDCIFFTAFYNDGALVDLRILSGSVIGDEDYKKFINENPYTVPDGVQFDTIKFMMLDSYSTLTPLATAKTIN